MRGWQIKESISAFALLWGVATLSACGSPGELASAGGGAQADEVAAIEEKLLGGQFTFARPEVGALFIDGGMCTATLIRPNVAVTAAHCVDFDTRDAGGRALGELVLDLDTRTQRTYTVDAWRSWGSDAGTADVALVRLAEAVPASVATPALLATTKPRRGSAVTWFGYGCGRRSGAESSSGRKQVLSFRLGATDNSCPGDSGGPTLRSDGSVFRVTSGYWVGGGGDIFGDVVALAGELNAQADAWVAGDKRADDAGAGGARDAGPGASGPAVAEVPSIVSTGIDGNRAWTEWQPVSGVEAYSVFLVAQLSSGDIAYLGKSDAGTATTAGTRFTLFDLNTLCEKIPRAEQSKPSALSTEVWAGEDGATAQRAALGYTITCR
jgi:V8-like Glu-specific endopeptidase